MTSSNKARRYLQHHKQHSEEYHNNQKSSSQLLVVDSTLSTTIMRKFRGKTQQQSSTTVSIPQICVNNNDADDNGHVAILNEFDQVLENELRRTSVSRTLSLKQSESTGHIGIPNNQQRSFSFALGSKTNLEGKKHDDDEEYDEIIHDLPSKSIKLRATSKSSLSKETFSRLFHSLTFRSGNHSTSKTSVSRISSQHPCLACQNYPNLDLTSKTKKRPSIFGVLVAKLNTSSNIENSSNRCSICKKSLSKTLSNNDDNQQLSSLKNLRDLKQLFLHTKRRQSLPSLIQNLLETSSIQHRPSFSSVLNHNLIDHQQLSKLSQSSGSLTESDDSYDNSSQLIEKVSRLKKSAYH
jgi:hypothetical protein